MAVPRGKRDKSATKNKDQASGPEKCDSPRKQSESRSRPTATAMPPKDGKFEY